MMKVIYVFHNLCKSCTNNVELPRPKDNTNKMFILLKTFKAVEKNKYLGMYLCIDQSFYSGLP